MGFKGKQCDVFDESICEKLDEADKYWQIKAKQKQSNDCKSKWCKCSNLNSNEQFNETSIKKHLDCVCVKEDDYEQLNRKQLDKLELALSPTIDQLMLVDHQDINQQNYLIEQLPLKLKNQQTTFRNAHRLDLQPNNEQQFHKLVREEEELIDSNLDQGDDLFVSLTLSFDQLLTNNQIESICTSMLAIYSLICNQQNLAKLNFACKSRKPNQDDYYEIAFTNSTQVRFYALDNDERVLSIGEIIIQESINNLKLKSILKRTYRLDNLRQAYGSNSSQLSRWQMHCLIVMNICIVFWLAVILIMIYILLSSRNEQLKSSIGKNRLLNLISLQLNRRLYHRSEMISEMHLNNSCNNFVIHNDLRSTTSKNNDYINVNKINKFKQLNLDKQQINCAPEATFNFEMTKCYFDNDQQLKINLNNLPSSKLIKPVHL